MNCLQCGKEFKPRRDDQKYCSKKCKNLYLNKLYDIKGRLKKRRGDWRVAQMTLKDIVFSNLNSAKENGYFEEGHYLHDATAEEIANDLIAFAEDCEEKSPEELMPHVKDWLDEQKKSMGAAGNSPSVSG